MVKLFKSGRVPEDRQGTIVEMIGKRGTADDLAFIYQQAIAPGGFSAPVRVKALDALAEAAANRKLRPPGDLEKLVPLIRPSSSPTEATARTVGGTAGGALEARGRGRGARGNWPLRRRRATCCEPKHSTPWRRSGVGRAGSRIEALAAAGQPAGTRLAAVAALAKLDRQAPRRAGGGDPGPAGGSRPQSQAAVWPPF